MQSTLIIHRFGNFSKIFLLAFPFWRLIWIFLRLFLIMHYCVFSFTLFFIWSRRHVSPYGSLINTCDTLIYHPEYLSRYCSLSSITNSCIWFSSCTNCKLFMLFQSVLRSGPDSVLGRQVRPLSAHSGALSQALNFPPSLLVFQPQSSPSVESFALALGHSYFLPLTLIQFPQFYVIHTFQLHVFISVLLFFCHLNHSFNFNHCYS